MFGYHYNGKQQFTMFQHIIAYMTERQTTITCSNTGIERKIPKSSFLRNKKEGIKRNMVQNLKNQARNPTNRGHTIPENQSAHPCKTTYKTTFSFSVITDGIETSREKSSNSWPSFFTRLAIVAANSSAESFFTNIFWSSK